MPLLDIDWEKNGRDPLSFLGNWAVRVSDALNAQFPKGTTDFVVDLDSRARQKVAGEVARFNNGPPTVWIGGKETDQKYPTFDPPAATLLAPARFTDRVGVHVRAPSAGPGVAAAVLFVTPDNKADSDASLAFAVRAAGFMAGGAGVVIVDILPGPPSWATHLHSLTGVYPLPRRPRGGEAPVLAVHPRVEGGAERYAVWHHAVAAGSPLPAVPVPVRGAMHLTLDLEATYAEACRNSRLPG